MTWEIGNKEVESLIINNKEVQSIQRISDNTILYESAIRTTTTLSANSCVNINETITLTGNCSAGSGKTIKLYQNDSFIRNITTTSNGNFNTLVSLNSSGIYTFRAVFNGDSTYTQSEATVSVRVINSPSSMTIKTTSRNNFIPISSSVAGITGNCMKIDWGDDTIEMLESNTALSHNYGSKKIWTITITGEIIEIPNNGLMGYFMRELILPNSTISIGRYAFRNCTSLIKVTIPEPITSISDNAFSGCTSLTDYQLYWTTPPITWNNNTMPNNTDTYFTIPHGTTANYVAKSFPSTKLIERSS